MKFGSTTCKDLGMGVPSIGSSKCEDPMAGTSLVCSGNSKTSVASQESPRQRVIGNEIGMGKT